MVWSLSSLKALVAQQEALAARVEAGEPPPHLEADDCARYWTVWQGVGCGSGF